MINKDISITDFSYELPEDKIAKYPLECRDNSKLLLINDGIISHTHFYEIENILDNNTTLIFNNTKVICARLLFYKQSGAKIEIFCLEPYSPADYERAFSVTGKCSWSCMVGNKKKWKDELLFIEFEHQGEKIRFNATLKESTQSECIVEFDWNSDTLTFGDILNILGKIPIPPYLGRDSEESDKFRYQTVYSKYEGSVAAPTAGLHFTSSLLEKLRLKAIKCDEVTLHVGAGTFLPVKSSTIGEHQMHTEHFEVNISTIENIIDNLGDIIAVGTTSVRTLESLPVLGYRALRGEDIFNNKVVEQWETYDIPNDITPLEMLTALRDAMKNNGVDKLWSATQIMIVPGYKFKVIKGLITNFHQPQSTLLLLISAVVGDKWREIYNYALNNEFRFLSYGDSSLLMIEKSV